MHPSFNSSITIVMHKATKPSEMLAYNNLLIEIFGREAFNKNYHEPVNQIVHPVELTFDCLWLYHGQWDQPFLMYSVFPNLEEYCCPDPMGHLIKLIRHFLSRDDIEAVYLNDTNTEKGLGRKIDWQWVKEQVYGIQLPAPARKAA